MVGFFKMWGVSGITTDGAKLSEPINRLGYCLVNNEYFSKLDATQKTEMIAVGKQVLAMKDSFEEYFYRDVKSYHDIAVKFLVMLAALLQGMDCLDWDWGQVRHYSQGLYGSMMNSRYEFESQNIALINRVMNDIKKLIESAVKT